MQRVALVTGASRGLGRGEKSSAISSTLPTTALAAAERDQRQASIYHSSPNCYSGFRPPSSRDHLA